MARTGGKRAFAQDFCVSRVIAPTAAGIALRKIFFFATTAVGLNGK
jgi:hypothetical protein